MIPRLSDDVILRCSQTFQLYHACCHSHSIKKKKPKQINKNKTHQQAKQTQTNKQTNSEETTFIIEKATLQESTYVHVYSVIEANEVWSNPDRSNND